MVATGMGRRPVEMGIVAVVAALSESADWMTASACSRQLPHVPEQPVRA
ncbi:MAG TPA: hypothetical protein VK064_06130 [Wenzhouxiangella sp.]|nr:hypothetical protein [Wenzhouxiangella sp.]